MRFAHTKSSKKIRRLRALSGAAGNFDAKGKLAAKLISFAASLASARAIEKGLDAAVIGTPLPARVQAKRRLPAPEEERSQNEPTPAADLGQKKRASASCRWASLLL
jgi:hypothetical protein